MARIAGIDIPRNKKVSYSLRYISGIGLTQAKNICDKPGVDQNIIVQKRQGAISSPPRAIFQAR